MDARDGARGYRREISRQVIAEAAARRRFVSYKDIATANGIEWTQARRTIPAHLRVLVRDSHRP